MAKSGRPLMPNTINNILYNVVDAYNKKFKLQRLNIETLNCYQGIRSHYATYGLYQNGRKENGRKVLQYIMGHAP